MGRDVAKLKGKGGGKFKYMSEKEMLELAAKFAPYRYALFLLKFNQRTQLADETAIGAFSCGICGALKMST